MTEHPDDYILIFRQPESPVMQAIKHNNMKEPKDFILAGIITANDSYLDQSASQPMISYAVAQDKREIVRMLLLYHADPNRPDTTGTTPLMRAFGLGRIDIARDLLEAGATTSIRDFDGNTCTDYAQVGGHEEMLSLLTGSRTEVSKHDSLSD